MDCERCSGTRAHRQPLCDAGHHHTICGACTNVLWAGVDVPHRCPGYDPEAPEGGDGGGDDGVPDDEISDENNRGSTDAGAAHSADAEEEPPL